MAVVCFKSHPKHQALFVVICFSFIIAVTDGCTYDFDCDIEMNQVCCNSECVYGSSCIGRYCTSDANCSIDESCCKSECTSDDCLGSEGGAEWCGVEWRNHNVHIIQHIFKFIYVCNVASQKLRYKSSFPSRSAHLTINCWSVNPLLFS